MSKSKKPFNSIKKFVNWTFGIYRAKDPGRGVLGITYPAAEDEALQTLILDASLSAKPSLVAGALYDAGALIDLKADIKRLAKALDKNQLISGRFIRKLGTINDNFFTPTQAYGPPVAPYLIEQTLLDLAIPHFKSKGTLEEWCETVLELAGRSSFLMFVIMLALAATLLKRAMSGVDEGFIINLAGDTSRGKTTALMVGKSVSGSPYTILTWNNSDRRLVEYAAALSDTLLTIDDLDKISSRPSFASDFSQLTHLLTSGVSKGYASNVQKTLPNLTWTCCGLTCARTSIEQLSASKGYLREGHERVRCFDISVPELDEGGIWDRLQKGEDSKELTSRLQANLTKNYGTALPVWLEKTHENKQTNKDVDELVTYFISLLDIDKNDGLSHRVAKKFGLVYAAGILALEHEIVQWSRDDIEQVVCNFYFEATKNLHSIGSEIGKGLLQFHKLIEGKSKIKKFATQKRPTFNSSKPPFMFIHGSDNIEYLYVLRGKFELFFVSPQVSVAAMELLKKNNILIKNSDQKRIRLIKAKPSEKKVRYMKLNYNLLRTFLKSKR